LTTGRGGVYLDNRVGQEFYLDNEVEEEFIWTTGRGGVSS
jgi:hypothetical protein